MISNELTPGMAALHANDGYGADIEYELKPDQGVFIGRSSNCGIKLRGDGLSDIHCRVGLEGGKLWIQDWMSTSGTRVNGQQIAAKTEIRNGDVIGVGVNDIKVVTGDMSNSSPSTASTSTATTQTVSTSTALTSAIDEISDQIDDCVAISPDQDDQPDEQLDDHSSLLSAFEDEPQTDSSPSDRGSSPGGASNDSDGFDFGDDLFGSEEDVTYDRETVALLEAEIEDLRSALAQRDAEPFDQSEPQPTHRPAEEASDEVLNRMQELIDEANRSDERAAILEEALQAAEEANQSEQEERTQLEAWVGDIEKRVGQREEEHLAEIEAMRQRLDKSSKQQELLQRKLREAATGGSAPKHYEESLENLQEDNRKLQEQLAGSKKQLKSREQKLEQKTEVEDPQLREERANLAQEQARISRMRYQLSDKLAAIDELPKTENPAEKETAARIHTLREHLRDIYEQEKTEEKEATLGTRLAKLWKRVDYEY